MCGLSKASQWNAAQALYVVGSLCEFDTVEMVNFSECLVAANIVTAFYAATFPGLVRDLPQLIQSEQEVTARTKTSAAFPLCSVLQR